MCCSLSAFLACLAATAHVQAMSLSCLNRTIGRSSSSSASLLWRATGCARRTMGCSCCASISCGWRATTRPAASTAVPLGPSQLPSSPRSPCFASGRSTGSASSLVPSLKDQQPIDGSLVVRRPDSTRGWCHLRHFLPPRPLPPIPSLPRPRRDFPPLLPVATPTCQPMAGPVRSAGGSSPPTTTCSSPPPPPAACFRRRLERACPGATSSASSLDTVMSSLSPPPGCRGSGPSSEAAASCRSTGVTPPELERRLRATPPEGMRTLSVRSEWNAWGWTTSGDVRGPSSARAAAKEPDVDPPGKERRERTLFLGLVACATTTALPSRSAFTTAGTSSGKKAASAASFSSAPLE
mmetsp:Transcript_987/g.2849  ORF Transcript_987/g.2849 Transcript_987/m.2849 type:complete len:352 (-) Transcript_987:231-1286(-)